jgi:DNA polymerase-3 subunit delta'
MCRPPCAGRVGFHDATGAMDCRASAAAARSTRARLAAPGPSGLGQYSLAIELARAWLCEQPSSQGACGQCPSCHAVDVHAHTDLCVLMPETIMLELGWPLGEKAQQDLDEKKRKASKEIRVDAMRDAVEFAQRTSAGAQGRASLSDRTHESRRRTLFKTLEEPPAICASARQQAAHQLLPTIHRRLGHDGLAARRRALAWLQARGNRRCTAAAPRRRPPLTTQVVFESSHLKVWLPGVDPRRRRRVRRLTPSGSRSALQALLRPAGGQSRGSAPVLPARRPASARVACGLDRLGGRPGARCADGGTPFQRRPDARSTCEPGPVGPKLEALT